MGMVLMEFRVLPVWEWSKVLDANIEPYATHGLPDPEHTILVVAEADGHILGVSHLGEIVVNHWAIAPAARRSPILVEGLWQETERVLIEKGVPAIHTTVADAQVDVRDMIERLGYVPAEGQLYIIGVGQSTLSKV